MAGGKWTIWQGKNEHVCHSVVTPLPFYHPPFFRVPLGAIGGPLGCEDVGAMPEPIQQRRGQLLIPKHLDPFAEGEIACNDRGALAVPFSQDVKE